MVTTSELIQRRGIAGREEIRRMEATRRPTPQQLMEQQERLIEVERKKFEAERTGQIETEIKDIDREMSIYQERVTNIQRQLQNPYLPNEKKDRLERDLTEAGKNISELNRSKMLIQQGYSPESVKRYTEARVLGWQQRQIAKQKAIQFKGEPLIAWREPSGKIRYQSIAPEVVARERLTPVVVGMVQGRFQELPQYQAEFPTITPTAPEVFRFPEAQQRIPTRWEKVKKMVFGTPFPQLERQITPEGRAIQKLSKKIITVPTQRILEVSKPVREYKLPYKLPPVTGQIGGIMTIEDIRRADPRFRTVQEVGAIPTEVVEVVGEKLRERAEMEIRGEPLFKPIVPQAVKLGAEIGAYVYAPTTMLISAVSRGATRYTDLDLIYERTLADQYELHTKEPVEEGYRHLSEQEFKDSYGPELREEIKQGVLLETGIPLTLLAGLGAYKVVRVLTKPRGVSTKILGTSKKVSPTLEGKQKIQTDILFETKTKTWAGTRTHVGVARSETITSDLGKVGETVTYGKFGQEGIVLPSGKFKVRGMKEFNVLTESVAKDSVITAQLEQAGIVSSADIKGFQELYAGKVALAKAKEISKGVRKIDVTPLKTDFIGTGTGVPILKTPETQLIGLFGKTIKIEKGKVVGKIPSIYEGGIFSQLGATDDLFFMGDSGIKLTQKQLTQIQVQRALIQAQVGISAVVKPVVKKPIPTIIPAVTTKPIIEIIKPDKLIVKTKPIVIKKVPTPEIIPVLKPLRIKKLEVPLGAVNIFEGIAPTGKVGVKFEGKIPSLDVLESRFTRTIIQPKIKAKEKARLIAQAKVRKRVRVVERARVTPVQWTGLTTKQVQRARVKAKLKAKQVQRQRVSQKFKDVLKMRVPIPVIPLFEKVRVRVGIIPKKRKRKKPLFDIAIRRRGKFKPLGVKLPLARAKALAKRRLKATLGVTARLIPLQKIREPIAFKETKEFRPYKIVKGKKVYTPLTIYQRRGFRLGTRGEVREIQVFKARKKEKWI